MIDLPMATKATAAERSPLLASTPAPAPAPPPSTSQSSLGTPLFPYHPHARDTPLWRKLLMLHFDGHHRVSPLHDRDIWPLEPEFEGAQAAADLQKHIPQALDSDSDSSRSRWRLLRAVCALNRRRLLLAAALRLLGTVLAVLRPLLLYRLLQQSTTNADRASTSVLPLVGLALVRLAVAFVVGHTHELEKRIELRTYSALYAMVTDRIVRMGSLSTAARDNATPAASEATGYKQRLNEITNMLRNDLDAVGDSLMIVTGAWATVLKLAASIAVLLYVVEISRTVVWTVLGVYAAVLVVELAVAEPLAQRAQSTLVFRLNTVHECLKGIQMVKLNAWEDKMEAKIQQARATERVASNRLNALVLVLGQVIDDSPMLLAAVAFGSHVWASDRTIEQMPLTPAGVFTALLLLDDCLQYARFLKHTAEVMLMGVGAWRRVESLLLLNESSQRGMPSAPTPPPLRENANDVVVEMSRVCLSSPQTASSSPTLLINVNWQVHQGELVVVHGAAGLGKSMLLAAIREDQSAVQLLQGSSRPMSSECRIAYCSQDPWLQALSIRDNILFGTAFAEDKYWTIVDACGLLEDLDALPAGDATVVGPRGINLSSGQSARIALARACYADADLYLLDCPLANVDPVVQSEIFRKCIVELLMFKTVVIVTHNPEYIGSSYVDQLVHVQPLSVKVTNRASKRKLQDKNSPVVSRRLRDYQRTVTSRDPADRSLCLPKLSLDSVRLVERIQMRLAASVASIQDKGSCAEPGLAPSTMWGYLFDAHRGYTVLSVALAALWGVGCVSRDVWIMSWAASDAQSDAIRPSGERDGAMLVFAYLVVGCVVLGFAVQGCIFLLTSQLASKLFTTMTHAVLHSSMALCYHTPIGETINRYYSDMLSVDELLPRVLSMFTLSMVSFLSRLLILAIVLGPVGVVVLVVGYAIATQSFSIPFCVVGVMTQLSARARLLSLISEIVDGETVIRAFGNQRALHVFRALDDENDKFKRVAYLMSVFNSSVILHSELVIAALILALLAFVSARNLTPAENGLALLYIFTLQQEIIAKFSTGLVNTIVCLSCVERLREYGSLKTEEEETVSAELLVSTHSATWPQYGGVVFEDVDFAYSSTCHDKTFNTLALRDVSFSLRGGEKVGVIGRTGSGKSSLAMALLRVHPLRSGRILLDGVDLRTVPLSQLRRSFTMIPQSPTFYRCSIRDYLDPFHEFDDARLWKELLTVELGQRVQSLEEELLDNGENWSLGQRQLLCFARALLTPSRVVVLDEAFSCVDQSCQEKILRILRERFASSTVVLITHRLDQILAFDRIVVMKGGRVVENGSAAELASDAGSVFYEFLETSLLTF